MLWETNPHHVNLRLSKDVAFTTAGICCFPSMYRCKDSPVSDLHLLLCRFDEASECSVLLPFVQVGQLVIL